MTSPPPRADCLILPHSIPHQGPGLLVTRLTAACGAVLLVDQAFQFAEWMHQGSGPGPLRLPGGKSLHTKVSADVRAPFGGWIVLAEGWGREDWSVAAT